MVGEVLRHKGLQKSRPKSSSGWLKKRQPIRIYVTLSVKVGGLRLRGARQLTCILTCPARKIRPFQLHFQANMSKMNKEKIPRTVAAQGIYLVTRRGFEPRTHCLKGSCSAD